MKLTRPWRRFNLYRHDWRNLGITTLILFVILTGYAIAGMNDAREEAREAAALAQKLAWHNEAIAIALLNELPLVDKDTEMVILSRIETASELISPVTQNAISRPADRSYRPVPHSVAERPR
jgi:hypothetical protein